MKGIFFDLDDTLINFGGVTPRAWSLTCEKLLMTFPNLLLKQEDIVAKILEINEGYWKHEDNRKKGSANPRLARHEILEQAFNDLGQTDVEMYLEFLLNNYAIYKEEAIYLFDDVAETLDTLKKMGKKLAMITNGGSKRQRDKLARFNLTDYFDLIWISEEQEFSKPDIRVYQKVLEEFNIQPEAACMVGDNYLWEVEAPIRCGMKGMYLDFEAKGLPEDATLAPSLVIKNIKELLTW